MGAGGAHLWQFGFSGEQEFRGGLCTGAAIPWAGSLPYRYITSRVLGVGGRIGRTRGERGSKATRDPGGRAGRGTKPAGVEQRMSNNERRWWATVLVRWSIRYSGIVILHSGGRCCCAPPATTLDCSADNPPPLPGLACLAALPSYGLTPVAKRLCPCRGIQSTWPTRCGAPKRVRT